MSMRWLLLLVALLAVLLAAGAARADAIDGDWCSAGGQRMSIRGDNITIPSGKQIVGNYSRHAFDYVIPPGDRRCGRHREHHPAQRISGVLAPVRRR